LPDQIQQLENIPTDAAKENADDHLSIDDSDNSSKNITKRRISDEEDENIIPVVENKSPSKKAKKNEASKFRVPEKLFSPELVC
jgi:hypothetical protein